MPDAFGNLTEEERMAMAIAQRKASPTTSGMTNPFYVPPEQDYSPQAAKIKNQREYANMLRGQSAPKGRTVGPLDVYMAPNWGETVANIGGQALGGYMSARADRASDDLSAQQATDAENRAQGLAQAKAAAEAVRVGERQEDMGREDAKEAARLALDEQKRLRDEERRIAANNAAILDEGAADMEAALQRKRDLVDSRRELSDRIAFEQAKEDIKGGGEAGEDLSAEEGKKRFQAEALGNAIDDIEYILDPEGGDYNSSGLGAYKDQLTGMFDLTRFAQSPMGAMLKSATNTAKEQILRAATGAAAPQTENLEYIETLVPRVGDDAETVRYKVNKLKQFENTLRELAKLPEADRSDDFWNEAANEIRENDPRYAKARRERQSSGANRGGQGGRKGPVTPKALEDMTDEELEAFING
jgi:hypothetical protein